MAVGVLAGLEVLRSLRLSGYVGRDALLWDTVSDMKMGEKIVCLKSQRRGDQNLLQKLLTILAAFSHSLSMVVGKKLCEPILLARALMGTAAFMPIWERRSPHPFFSLCWAEGSSAAPVGAM